MFLLELQALEVVNSWSLRDLLSLTFWESRSWGSGEGTTHFPKAICAQCPEAGKVYAFLVSFSEYP